MKNLSSEVDSLIQQYLNSSKVVVVDQNSSARIGIKKILSTMGVSVHHIFLGGSIEEAADLIQQHKPTLVFCDYQINGKFGLDLLQKQREENSKEVNQCLFILVTSNTSQSAVAQAAEEDIDAYILKPYTIEGFTISLIRAIQTKIKPSDYLKLINEGKLLLEIDEFEKALSTFKSAITKDSKPSLAYFYEGLTQFKQAFLNDSQVSYEKGLSFNKIHYKCLVGLFDLLMQLEKYELAYEVVQKIVRFFPANPKRLSTVLKLAIQTQHYADVELFYKEFLKIEERNNDLIKCVCAALIVCGRYFFQIGENDKGVDFVQKASVTAAGRHFILRKSIELLVQYDHLEESKAVFKRFSNPIEEDLDYSVARFLILSKESEPTLIVSKGLELIKRGVKEIEVYRITLNLIKTLGSKQRAQEFEEEAVKVFPELSNESQKKG